MKRQHWQSRQYRASCLLLNIVLYYKIEDIATDSKDKDRVDYHGAQTCLFVDQTFEMFFDASQDTRFLVTPSPPPSLFLYWR